VSGAVGGATYGALNQILAASTSLGTQIGTLQQQVSSGKVTESYSGLASAASQVQALNEALSQTNAYTATITTAQGKATAMQDALTQIQSLVSTMASATLGLTGSSASSSVDGVATQAQQALQQLGSLLNTTYGGDYVFSGADTANPPVPAPDNITSSAMYTQIGTAVAALATTPSTTPVATVIANTVTAAASPSAGVFSSYLTGAGATAGATAPVQVQIGTNESVTLDLPANQNVGAVSDPSIDGTGNAITDVMRALAVVANSTGTMAGNPDFATLMQNAATTLTSANTTLAQESGQIGLSQQAMTTATNAYSTTQTNLSARLSNLTDVNMASAISQLQTVSNQLEASYRVISMASSLDLASYLS
jgi:flagellin-like hook-associated protein FlgL